MVGKPFEVSELRTAAAAPDGSRVVLGNSYWLGAWDPKTGERCTRASGSMTGRNVWRSVRTVRASPPATSSRGLDVGFGQGNPGEARVWDAATGDAVSPNEDARDVP